MLGAIFKQNVAFKCKIYGRVKVRVGQNVADGWKCLHAYELVADNHDKK